MNTLLPKIRHKRNKSFQPSFIKEFNEQNIQELISKKDENEIESSYSKKDLILIKSKIIIHRIKKLRNESALKIQKMWIDYLNRLKIHKLAHRVRGCYTISPSIKNVTKIFIKIFTNELNKDEFKILPLRFCPIRKSFVIDIPKNKFYSKKKILRFNFIRNDSIFYDENYNKTFYCNEFVHEVDLSLYDKKQKILDETIYNSSKLKPLNNSSKDTNCLSTEDEKENSESSVLTPEKLTKNKKNFNSSDIKISNIDDEEDEYAGLRLIRRKGTNDPLKHKIVNRFKRFESFDVTYSCKTKLKSILRCSNYEEFQKRKLNNDNCKKVSFGDTFYQY